MKLIFDGVIIMDNSKKLLTLLPILPVLCCAFLLGGCYTKLASYQNETMAASGGECADCGDEAPVNNRREVCVWERDIFGFPEMRCYTTNYSSSWMYFHSTPWWYRSNYRWYDSRGCPPHYYYDRGSGICRYYGASTYPSGGGGGGGGSASTQQLPPRRNSRVVPEEKPVVEPAPVTSGPTTLPSGPPMFSGGGAGKQLSPVNNPPPSSSASANAGISKEPENKPSAQPSPPPPEQRPKDDAPKTPPPRRSSRGI
jgi:hypothetical protein